MIRFLAGRLLQAVITLALLATIVFVMSRVLGSPLDTLLPLEASPEAREQAARAWGLDQPLLTQYWIFMSNLLRLELGSSIRSNEPVINLLQSRLPASLELAGVAMLFTSVVAIGLGSIAALNRGRALDSGVRLLALVGMSAPSFWLGILGIVLFAVHLGWLPASGRGGISHYVLPAITMSTFALAGLTRLVRNSMLEILSSDFVLFARTKGVTERTVIWKHALRNALIPVLGFSGVYFAIMITMAVVIEVVFSWPGMGSLAYTAILLRDYPIMQGVILATGVIVVAVSLVVDILYAAVDPRVRSGVHG